MRLYTEHDLAAGQEVPLTANQAHYLRNVMRARPGDAVSAFNGRDGEWEARIEALSKGVGTLSPDRQTRKQTSEPGPWLLFAPIKRGPLDFMVQKAVELGASALWPVMTERTNAGRVNMERLAANTIEAAEQCERLTLPDLRAPEKYSTVLDNWPQDRQLLVCVERGAVPAMGSVLQHQAGIAAWAILTGPEGGFSPSELDQLTRLPFVSPVSLGPRILRAETAALAALVCWQCALGDWNRPLPPRTQ
ncbi:MAG: 16S rRNA (uracil(1498)-N(3))-methyltransferase [Proteobacteria bacterium]|nr:16S rRNA (uracil(1498)-N(3))-methyltransferase [Pseudomonadota bacterium]